MCKLFITLLLLVASVMAAVDVRPTTTVVDQEQDKAIPHGARHCGAAFGNALNDPSWFYEASLDNCLAVHAKVVDSTLQYGVYLGPSSSELTLDRYTVFISKDREHLMPLIDLAPFSRQLDLSRFSFPVGTYYLYVKAVGKPMFINHFSYAVTYTVQP